ncbi:MDR/zinc-dependent alcohol dehydrogenase-like family protein [Chitinophaga rhizophila]|uniref:Uncharacterized protein n=1 Tax=Chitinophaga rhizophila TaxID=2866212 RepID=A0ABS7G957_9BACT|nr:hypothetical protein [Chitinophaga rhizophila]MBW8683976.1 hypothetical protein [Chitinophaga rhizophila]
MDYERYISDGNLEKVLLGFATPEEEEEFRMHLAFFPEIQTEKEEIERRIERLAFREAALPPAQLKTTIMQRIAMEPDARPGSGNWYDRQDVRFENVQPPPNTMRVHVGWKILLISLLVMIAGSVAAAVIFFFMT